MLRFSGFTLEQSHERLLSPFLVPQSRHAFPISAITHESRHASPIVMPRVQKAFWRAQGTPSPLALLSPLSFVKRRQRRAPKTKRKKTCVL